MLYAVRHNKVDRSVYKANEDALTASIFERLMYLPQELTQYIFTQALFDSIEDLRLDQITSITYWPSWDATGTGNTSRVEPDVFIRCLNSDIIIEAKRYDTKQQNPSQWKNEIQAYYNEFEDDEKPLIFIALGGLHTNKTGSIKVNEKEYKIYKCSWKAILNIVQHLIYDMELAGQYTHSNKATINILSDIVLCFELFGFATSLWLERFVPAPQIKPQSINYFSQPWTN